MFRHPVKGFTPEQLNFAELVQSEHFPCDRLYAVENGPSGIDPLAPTHISKWKFTVLADIPRVALARSSYDESTCTLMVHADDLESFEGALDTEAGRAAFADWLTQFLGSEVRGPLRVLRIGQHRFMDDPAGHLSLINLSSVRDLGAKLHEHIDPRRFRANIYVEGWPAWSELELQPGTNLRLGTARAVVVKPIERCIATHVAPESGERDVEIVPALRKFYGHIRCGVYLQVAGSGRIETGCDVEVLR